MNLLIVDDEPIVINSLIKRIGWDSYGFTNIYSALSMKGALDILGQTAIHLLLCDIEMPQGNGLELFEQVKLYFPKTECIFVTCHDDYHYLRRALQLGSFDYILKPIDYTEFGTIIQNAALRIQSDTPKNDGCMLDFHAIPKCENEYVEKILLYIQEHISNPISITDISSTLHLNSQYTMRMFKKNMGQSILTYITQQRIELAKSLLSSTNLSVSHVAAAVGINNTSYFIKLFRKNIGRTPGEYRMMYSKDAGC